MKIKIKNDVLGFCNEKTHFLSGLGVCIGLAITVGSYIVQNTTDKWYSTEEKEGKEMIGEISEKCRTTLPRV